MGRTVGFISLGCAKNQVDTEGLAGILKQAGFDPVSNAAQADIIVVNTCCFIEPAKEESIEAILEAAQHKAGRCRVLAVIGCLTQRYGKELKKLIPEVDLWIGTGEYDRLPQLLNEAVGGEGAVYQEGSGWLQPDGTIRIRSTPAHWAYMKLADGCDNRCSYCVIPSVRGSYRSRTMKGVMDEVSLLLGQGVKEINLIAQDITAYGRDFSEPSALVDLLAEIDQMPGDFWIRLLYAYPTRVTDQLLQFMAQSKHVLHYLDIPMQHVNEGILERMGRAKTIGMLPDLIQRIRNTMPDSVIRSTFILGFPGETEEAFQELLQFVGTQKLDWVGAFPYSREEGTPAAEMRPLVHHATKTRRVRQLMEVQAQITADRLSSMVGGKLKVLVEEGGSRGGWGRSYREAPEVDGRIQFSGAAKPGEFREAEIIGVLPPYDLQATLVKS